MNKTPSDGSHRNVANSQEPEVVKDKITFESALRKEAIDEAFVARKLKDLLRAQRRRWNPKKQSWEKFEDHATQLAALREIAKVFGIFSAHEDTENSGKILHFNISALPFRRKPVLPTTDSQQDSSK